MAKEEGNHSSNQHSLCNKPASALLSNWVRLTVVALPGSFRNPDSYDSSTPDTRVTACPVSIGLQQSFRLGLNRKRQELLYKHLTHPPPGHHLAVAFAWALTWRQYNPSPSCLSKALRIVCLENVENTSALAVDRRLVYPHDDGFSERRDHDGDIGTAAKHYLEKLNLTVACFGCGRNAERNDDFMISVRGRMTSWPQRYVSMFVYIFPYTTYEEMRIPHANPGLLVTMRRMSLQ